MKTVKYLLAFFFVFLAVSVCGCSHSAKTSAEKAIEKDLDLLKNLDPATTMKYISYQELFPDSDDNTELSDDIKEVFTLFFGISITKFWIFLLQDQKAAFAHIQLTTLNAETHCKRFCFLQAFRMKYYKLVPAKKSLTAMRIPWNNDICFSTAS